MIHLLVRESNTSWITANMLHTFHACALPKFIWLAIVKQNPRQNKTLGLIRMAFLMQIILNKTIIYRSVILVHTKQSTMHSYLNANNKKLTLTLVIRFGKLSVQLLTSILL